MIFRSALAAIFAVIVSCSAAFGQATLLPSPELCFSALGPTSGGAAGTGTGFIGLLGTITGGSGGASGTYFTALTGGSGSGGTATVTVSGGAVTAVSIVNPGVGYIVGDVLSAASGNIGNVTGFIVPVASVAINSALAGGSASFFIPGTQTFKQTWQNAAETILNQNPVPLDQNGCAIVYGAGIYRLILKDSLGNTVFDQVTASTGSSGVFWAGTAGGTGNAITVTDAAFSNQDGTTIQFRALAPNSGPTQIQVSGGSFISVVKDTLNGPVALSGGEIGTSNTPMVTYDALNAEFHLVNPASTSSGSGSSGGSLTPPQGYLNLLGQATGSVVQGANDVIAATTLFYSPFVGSIVPIFNGTAFVNTQISEMTLTLTSAGSPTNAIQDACIFSNNGVPTLVLGPSWTSSSAGSGSRGTGPGTAQITRLQGIWVNAVSITAYNGISSYTVAASQCTYVGSVYIDSTAGQISNYRTWGQSRKWGVWNAYNRQPLYLKAGDSTASWNFSGSFHPSHGNTANSLTVFTGLPEEPFDLKFNQQIQLAANASTSQYEIGIGWNNTAGPSGLIGNVLINSGAAAITTASTVVSEFFQAPSIGINTVTALEGGPLNNVGSSFFGTEADMVLSAQWRG